MARNNQTIEENFTAGMNSGKNPVPQNNAKALLAVTRKDTPPLIRAYWSGYLCQAQLDDPTFMFKL